MIQKSKNLFLAAICFFSILNAFAQYPDIPKDVQQASDSLMRAANKHSDSAWQVAWPIIQKEAREGKPYIPWASRVDELPRDQEIVVVCRSGNRSQQGRAILLEAGFTQVTSMAGGVTQWRAAGHPTVSGP